MCIFTLCLAQRNIHQIFLNPLVVTALGIMNHLLHFPTHKILLRDFLHAALKASEEISPHCEVNPLSQTPQASHLSQWTQRFNTEVTGTVTISPCLHAWSHSQPRLPALSKCPAPIDLTLSLSQGRNHLFVHATLSKHTVLAQA